jgi:crinkler effector protein
MGEFKLWCCVEGDCCYFGVPISPDYTIDDLRVQIYNKKKALFISCGDADLSLKKVRHIMISM